MCQPASLEVHEDGVENSSHNTKKALPRATHMRRVRRIEPPNGFAVTQQGTDLWILHVDCIDVKFICRPHKICATIRTKFGHRSPQSIKPMQCIYERGGTHFFNEFNMYCPTGQASEEDTPPLGASTTTTGTLCADLPRSENIHAHKYERGARC